jgi:nucleoside-diphosphate-sugar epimerase
MRIFVIGSGSAVVRKLIEAGHEITGLVRSVAAAATLLLMADDSSARQRTSRLFDPSGRDVRHVL